MDQRKTKAFFEGRDIHAYNIFGAHLEGDGVRFRVYAPNAKNISVIGTFNNWDDQASKMKKDKRGIWECFVQGAKNQDSYKRSMDICAHAGFEPKVIMYFDQLQTAYNVARSGQSGIIFFRDALLKYTEKTEKLCYYKIGDPLAKRAILLSMKRYPGVGATVDDFIKYILLAKK